MTSTISEAQVDAAFAAWAQVWRGSGYQSIAKDAIRAALIAAAQAGEDGLSEDHIRAAVETGNNSYWADAESNGSIVDYITRSICFMLAATPSPPVQSGEGQSEVVNNIQARLLLVQNASIAMSYCNAASDASKLIGAQSRNIAALTAAAERVAVTMSTADTDGRAWAKLSSLKEGDLVELDGGFTCHPAGKVRLFRGRKGLYFRCGEGEHYVSGQADDGEHCVGIYQVTNVEADSV